MITIITLSFIVSLLTMVFSFFPQVDVLPTIAGVNLDTIIIGGIGNILRLADVFWYITNVIQGFIYIAGYLALKMTLKFLAGIFRTWGGGAMDMN
jgi:hypothetical protein